MNPQVNHLLRYLAIAVLLRATSLPLLAAGPTGTIGGTVLDSKFEQSGLEDKAEISTSVFAILRPGDTSERVVVQGEANQVDTRTGSKGTHLAYNIDANAALNGGDAPDPTRGN